MGRWNLEALVTSRMLLSTWVEGRSGRNSREKMYRDPWEGMRTGSVKFSTWRHSGGVRSRLVTMLLTNNNAR